MAQAEPFRGIDRQNLDAADEIQAFWGRLTQLSSRVLHNTNLSDPEYRGILQSNPYVEDNDGDDEWVPQRGLGKGGFGAVVHFARQDELGETIDDVAIKQQNLNNDVWDEQGAWVPQLTKEAFFHSQLCTNDQARCIVDLRRYKCYVAELQTRLYLEYTRYGDLSNITDKYFFWQKYVPELLLWCVFEKLAEAADLLNRCPKQWHPMWQDPQNNPNRNASDPNNFLLQMDIKPQNILVFDRTTLLDRHDIPIPENGKIPKIPVVKLNDFGLTRVANRNELLTANRFRIGTAGYIPPEIPQETDDPRQPHVQAGAGWVRPIFAPHRTIDERHNVWAIGKVMFELMTFFSWDFCKRKWQNNMVEADYDNPASNKYLHYLRPIPLMPCSARTDMFMRELHNLIRGCLAPNPQFRPTSDVLLNDIKIYKQYYIEFLQRQPGRNDMVREWSEVALTKAEMNDLPLGDDINLRRDWGADPNTPGWYRRWKDVRANKSLDPNEPLLKPDKTEFIRFYSKEIYEERRVPGRHHWTQAGGMADIRPEDIGTVERYLADPPPRKRMRSWDENDEEDSRFRAKIRDLRNRFARSAVQNQPLRLFTHVLRQEKLSVAKAERVLRWMFVPGAAAPDEEWVTDPDIDAKARRAKTVLTKKGVVTFRLLPIYRYFVAQAAYGRTQANEAIEDMISVFKG